GGGVAALLAGPLVTRFLTLSPSLEREAALCFMILAAATPAVVITNGFRGLLEADQRFGFINAIRIPVSTANFAVPLVGVWLDWSLPGIVGWMVVTRLAALVAYASACLRAWPSLRGPLRVERERFGSLTRFGGWVTVSALVSALLVYADRFVAGALVSVEAVGYYTVPHEMVTRLEVLPASLVLTLFPALSGLSSRGGGTAAASEERARLVLRSIEYVLAFVGPLLVVLAAGGDDILSVWLGASFAERAATPLRILALGMLANAVAFVPAAALQAAGRPDIPAKFHLLELPLHLGVVWVLTARWGLVGAATAWSIRTALDAALLLGASSRLGFTRGAPTRVPRVVGALSVLAVGACGVVLAMHSAPWTLAGLAALGLLWAVWCWRSLLGPSERRRLLRALGGGPS
ncbi:MAG: flippase, partial [Gemmatimonadota bacterium]